MIFFYIKYLKNTVTTSLLLDLIKKKLKKYLYFKTFSPVSTSTMERLSKLRQLLFFN